MGPVPVQSGIKVSLRIIQRIKNGKIQNRNDRCGNIRLLVLRLHQPGKDDEDRQPEKGKEINISGITVNELYHLTYSENDDHCMTPLFLDKHIRCNLLHPAGEDEAEEKYKQTYCKA